MKIETATIRRLRDALLQSGRRPSTVVSPAYEILTRQSMLSEEEKAALHRVDPLAETMFLMMAADGKLAEEERDAVRGAIRGLSDDILHAGTIKVMMEQYENRLHEQGRDARLQEIAADLAGESSEAEGAFALAAAVALADERVVDQEDEFIRQLAGWFRISDQRAREILHQLEQDQNSEC